MKILIIGDSFIEGVGATNKDGWSQCLKKQYPDHSITLSGIGGDTIKKILERLKSFTSSFDIVVLAIGINDSRYRPSKNDNEISLAGFEAGLKDFKKFFDHFNENVKMYVVGLTNVDESKTDPYIEDKHYLNKQINKFDEVIQSFSKKNKAHYLSVPTLTSESNLLSDGLHPSDKGHKKLYRLINAQLDW